MISITKLPKPFWIILATALGFSFLLLLFSFVTRSNPALEYNALYEEQTVADRNEISGSWFLENDPWQVRFDLAQNGQFELRMLNSQNLYRQFAARGTYAVENGKLFIQQREALGLPGFASRPDINIQSLPFQTLQFSFDRVSPQSLILTLNDKKSDTAPYTIQQWDTHTGEGESGEFRFIGPVTTIINGM